MKCGGRGKTIALALSFAAMSAFGAGNGAPFEQTQFDRTPPNVLQKVASQAASSGATGITSGGGLASGVWANDHNFVAPTL